MLKDSFIKSSGNATEEATFNSYCGMFTHPPGQTFLKDKYINILSQSEVQFHGDLDIISLNIDCHTLDKWQFQVLLFT
jgi:hypothetical protein